MKNPIKFINSDGSVESIENSIINVNDKTILNKGYIIKSRKQNMCLPELTAASDNASIHIYSVTSDWGSPAIQWNNQPAIDTGKVYKSRKIGNKYYFNITDLVVSWCKYISDNRNV